MLIHQKTPREKNAIMQDKKKKQLAIMNMGWSQLVDSV